MHGLDGAAGYRIETCRLCACTAQPLLRPKQLPGPPLASWTLTPFFQAVFATLSMMAAAITVRIHWRCAHVVQICLGDHHRLLESSPPAHGRRLRRGCRALSPPASQGGRRGWDAAEQRSRGRRALLQLQSPGPAATGERGTGPLRRRRSQVSMPKVANAVQIQSLCRSAQPAHPCAHPPRGLLRDGRRRLRPRPEGRCCAARWASPFAPAGRWLPEIVVMTHTDGA